MSTHSPGVPPKPNLDFYRKQAKSLLKSARAGDMRAIERLENKLALHAAQFAIARENGFASWPKLRVHVLAAAGSAPLRFLPHVRGIKWYGERVAGIVSMQKSGLPEAMESIRRAHPKFANASDEEIRAAKFTNEDARIVLARDHGFSTWNEFKSRIRAIKRGEFIEPFTQAFDAIQAGDSIAFAQLLKNHPDLLNAQGTNGSSLLNLAVSLRRPAICKILIDAGTDVDLPSTRGVTPLHATAHLNEPDIARMLLEAGASPEVSAYGDGGTPLIMSLFGSHDATRDLLAAVGIFPDNLRAAAGVGRMDLVRACFHGRDLTPQAIAHRGYYRLHTGFPLWTPTNSRQEILDEAFTYAARNGQIGVLQFLLDMGADINGDPYRGTALDWSVRKSRMETVLWLLDHGADINRRATFGGPKHGQGYTALHAAVDTNQFDFVKLLIARGADPNIKEDNYHATPRGWAEHFGRTEMAEYLRQAEAG